MRLTVLFCMLATAAPLRAHDIHQSTAEAEYNAQTQKLEVSLTVFINDLEIALIRHTERRISFDQTPAAELDAAIQSYLAKTFVLTDAAGKEARLEWTGREVDAATAKSGDPSVTLFFEMTLPGGMGGATLRHAVFCDLFPDQANLLQLKFGNARQEMHFSRAMPVKGVGG